MVLTPWLVKEKLAELPEFKNALKSRMKILPFKRFWGYAYTMHLLFPFQVHTSLKGSQGYELNIWSILIFQFYFRLMIRLGSFLKGTLVIYVTRLKRYFRYIARSILSLGHFCCLGRFDNFGLFGPVIIFVHFYDFGTFLKILDRCFDSDILTYEKK